MDTTGCPECGTLAEVEWRAVLESTDGPVEHARVRCVQKHSFLLPLASLQVAQGPAQTKRSSRRDSPSGPDVIPTPDQVSAAEAERQQEAASSSAASLNSA
jgi:hypothetical protein